MKGLFDFWCNIPFEYSNRNNELHLAYLNSHKYLIVYFPRTMNKCTMKQDTSQEWELLK